jgi:hypothetical protein
MLLWNPGALDIGFIQRKYVQSVLSNTGGKICHFLFSSMTGIGRRFSEAKAGARTRAGGVGGWWLYPSSPVSAAVGGATHWLENMFGSCLTHGHFLVYSGKKEMFGFVV